MHKTITTTKQLAGPLIRTDGNLTLSETIEFLKAIGAPGLIHDRGFIRPVAGSFGMPREQPTEIGVAGLGFHI